MVQFCSTNLVKFPDNWFIKLKQLRKFAGFPMVTRGFMVVSRKDCKGAKTQKEITIHMRHKIFSTMA